MLDKYYIWVELEPDGDRMRVRSAPILGPSHDQDDFLRHYFLTEEQAIEAFDNAIRTYGKFGGPYELALVPVYRQRVV